MSPEKYLPSRPSSPVPVADVAALDHPVEASLDGHHAHLSRRIGRAATYCSEVATFCSVPAQPEPGDWADLARLLGSGALADLFSGRAQPPADWEPVFAVDGLQMVAPPVTASDAGAPDTGLTTGTELVELGPSDRADMLELVERTRPGPFRPRTPELGTYLGIRQHGTLIAMAGERLQPPGWTEISAVCTAPEARGHGHAGRLVRTLAARISARGDGAFLHVVDGNASAIALYTRLGFRPRARVAFRGFRVP
ncbi:GNAT family N-acetyltransferase [Rhodococcus phenolicus]|uniref:GNAT family N-acetyltransferase n=1 Tax=Rhodococcus phenolicus TaxID=263849 RepID=UPI00082D04D5|nr:GNAT family N-acetyltransferase [Rhodococcus phenolicus]